MPTLEDLGTKGSTKYAAKIVQSLLLKTFKSLNSSFSIKFA